MLYIKAKMSLLLSVFFCMCTFFSTVFQSIHLTLGFCVPSIFFAILHVKYDWAYLDYDTIRKPPAAK